MINQYRKKPVVIEAITFDQFVQYGRDNGGNIVGGMPWSFSYNGHPVTHEDDRCYLIPTLEGTMRFTPNDMLITGVKGEIYPCKADIFEATYDAVTAEPTPPCTNEFVASGCELFVKSGLTFGLALEQLKSGRRIAREGWNGKRMFLFLLPAGKVPKSAIHDPKLREVIDAEIESDTFEALGSIRMFTADKKVLTGWLASQTDMLSEDWTVLE